MDDFDWGIYTELQEKKRLSSTIASVDSLPMQTRVLSKCQVPEEDLRSCQMQQFDTEISLLLKIPDVDWGYFTELQIRKKLSSSNISLTIPLVHPKVLSSECISLSQEPEEYYQKRHLNPEDVETIKKLLKQSLYNIAEELPCQKDSNSPLHSVKSFEDLKLRHDLLKGVYSMRFNRPSKIQESVLPVLTVYPPANIIAQSQSGTGKTAAFLLAALSRIDPYLKYPQVLILTPTYELAIQLLEVAINLAQFCNNVQFRLATPGESFHTGHRVTEAALIGTPGDIYEWANKCMSFDFDKIQMCIFDEADVLFSSYIDHSICIHQELSSKCQTLLFSTTYTDEVFQLAEHIISDPVIVRLRNEEQCITNVKQFYTVCRTQQDKYEALCKVNRFESKGKCIVFCELETAAWLADRMSKDGHDIALLTGGMKLEDRKIAFNSFRTGKAKVLITTNMSARGINVEQTTVVLNFDLPLNNMGEADCETYLHRIGRTGRFGRPGVALSIVDDDRSIDVLKQIEEHFGKTIIQVDVNNADDMERMRSLCSQ